ncbi:hypothetical protein [Mesoplasma tabanidae]|uniref:Uncharacterized protein n=1 Tax=Mesoplasma tabanidae TaxID=219745 RepID=A0A2K8P652_9MOLU|nr:hypothetical protein [Mesoplasma tabanidae]ATZ21610.1 hypothetical protein MTABA_v1c04110 [Mesoplasma tabanidae]
MDNKKIYISISYLIFNIIKNNKLKYYLRKDEAFRKEVIKLIDLLLLLESDKFKCRYNRKKIAAEFAKAYVKITKVSNRFEATEEEINSEEIYAEYSRVVGFISENYKTTRKTLTNEEELFTIEDIELNGKLAADFVKKMDEKIAAEAKDKAEKEAKEKAEKEKTNPEAKKTATNSENINQQNFNNQNFNQQQNFFGGNMGGNMPQNIFLNPKFYPFKTKPKYMPLLKIILTILLVITAALFTALYIYASTVKIELKEGDLYFKALFGDFDLKNKDHYSREGYKDFNSINSVWNILGSQSAGIFPIIFSIILFVWIAYMGYSISKKTEDSKRKYRISGFTLFIVIFLMISIISYSFSSISIKSIESQWGFFEKLKIVSKDAETGKETATPADFAAFFDLIKTNFSSQISAIITISILTLGFSFVTILFSIFMVIINPKKDLQKIMKARAEQTNATMAAMQGKHYEIDPSLFDEDEQN